MLKGNLQYTTGSRRNTTNAASGVPREVMNLIDALPRTCDLTIPKTEIDNPDMKCFVR